MAQCAHPLDRQQTYRGLALFPVARMPSYHLLPFWELHAHQVLSPSVSLQNLSAVPIESPASFAWNNALMRQGTVTSKAGIRVWDLRWRLTFVLSNVNINCGQGG